MLSPHQSDQSVLLFQLRHLIFPSEQSLDLERMNKKRSCLIKFKALSIFLQHVFKECAKSLLESSKSEFFLMLLQEIFKPLKGIVTIHDFFEKLSDSFLSKESLPFLFQKTLPDSDVKQCSPLIELHFQSFFGTNFVCHHFLTCFDGIFLVLEGPFD